MVKVVVTDFPFETLDIETAILTPLGCQVQASRKAPPPEELAGLVAEADYVLTVFARLSAGVIAAMRKARAIVRYGVGVDNVDLDAARQRGIPVCNVPDYCMDEVADHTLALILALTRQVVSNCNTLRTGHWGLTLPQAEMRTLCDMTVGVVGLGRIGREVVRRLRAFKCRLLVYDPVLAPADVRAHGGEPVSLEELLDQSDLVTLHCPSTAQTYRLINRQSLGRMKPGSILINVGRGTLVDTEALDEALERGQLAGAGLDVFDPEPPLADSPLMKRANVVVSPHVAAVSARSVRKLRETVAGIVAQSIRGQRLPNIVNGVPA